MCETRLNITILMSSTKVRLKVEPVTRVVPSYEFVARKSSLHTESSRFVNVHLSPDIYPQLGPRATSLVAALVSGSAQYLLS